MYSCHGGVSDGLAFCGRDVASEGRCGDSLGESSRCDESAEESENGGPNKSDTTHGVPPVLMVCVHQRAKRIKASAIGLTLPPKSTASKLTHLFAGGLRRNEHA